MWKRARRDWSDSKILVRITGVFNWWRSSMTDKNCIQVMFMRPNRRILTLLARLFRCPWASLSSWQIILKWLTRRSNGSIPKKMRAIDWRPSKIVRIFSTNMVTLSSSLTKRRLPSNQLATFHQSLAKNHSAFSVSKASQILMASTGSDPHFCVTFMSDLTMRQTSLSSA